MNRIATLSEQRTETLWILLPGGLFLSFTAGFINLVSFMGLFHQAISHTTGNITRLGEVLATGRLSEALPLVLILLSFMLGSMISGLITHDSHFRPGRRYGILLMIESSLIFMAAGMLLNRHPNGEYLLSAACGLQNAMATNYSGAVVRTTHMTGILTDLGLLLGKALRTGSLSLFRVSLFLSLVAGFLGGGIGGAFVFRKLGFASLYVVSAWVFAAGFMYFLYRIRVWKGASP